MSNKYHKLLEYILLNIINMESGHVRGYLLTVMKYICVTSKKIGGCAK